MELDRANIISATQYNRGGEPQQTRTRLLQEVFTKYISRPVDWERTVAEFMKTKAYFNHSYNISKFKSELSEIHVNLGLNDAIKDAQSSSGFSRIQKAVVDSKVRFGKDDRFSVGANIYNKLVVEDHSKDSYYLYYTEVDALAIIDEAQLVVFEVKLGKVKMPNKKINDIRSALRPENITHRLLPLQMYFNMPAFYVVVSPRDLLGKNSTTIQSFLERGGNYVELNESRSEFHEKAVSILNNNTTLQTRQTRSDPQFK